MTHAHADIARSRLSGFALLAGLLLALGLSSRAHAQLVLPQTVSVMTDDGVALATDVWRNLLDGSPRAVLLRRTPYGRTLDVATVAALTNAGFIVVSQDVRGRGDSGGTFLPFFNDKEDGRATIDWIAQQPWSNGRVGTYSSSAEGIVQYMAMASAPSALACSHIMMATPNVYQAIFLGGAWRTDLDTAWLTALGATDVITQWKAHEVQDGYWDAATLSTAEIAKVDHPVFVMGGFFDIFANDEHRIAQALQQGVAPSSRGDIYFVLGPWTHGGFGSTRQGQLLLPDAAAMTSWGTDFQQYLDWCLLGAARPPYANVRYWVTELTDDTMLDSTDKTTRVVAQGEWHDADVWPPEGVLTSTLWLADAHQLGPSGDADPVALPVDPSNPTPSNGGGNFSTTAGPTDQGQVDARSDVYVASSALFTQETLLVGAPHAVIWAASATTDIDVVVRLELVTPGGKSILFSDGIRRGRFVNGYDTLRPLTPNQPVAFDIELGPIALRVPAGQALRVAISAASSPRYEQNPNQATPLAQNPTPVPTTLTIYRDRTHPSRIELPVLSGQVPDALVGKSSMDGLDGGTAMLADGAVRPASDAAVPMSGLDAALSDSGVLDAGAAPKHDRGCSLQAGNRRTGGGAWWLALGLLAWRRRSGSRRRV